MKILGIFYLFFLMFSCLICSVEHDDGGLFLKIMSERNGGARKFTVTYEPREKSLPEKSLMDSLVFNIHGMAQFTKLVVKNSYAKPVVLKIYSPTCHDLSKVTPVFQSVADDFKNQVIFAGLDISQNMDIFMQISTFYKLKNVELPLFLFYKQGQLIMPFLTGFQPHTYLSDYIQKRFFVLDEEPSVLLN